VNRSAAAFRSGAQRSAGLCGSEAVRLDGYDVEFGSMKNLRNAQDKEEIARRLESVRPGSQRLWAKCPRTR